MTCRDEPHTPMSAYYGRQRVGVVQVIHIHVADSGDKRRVMQKQQRRTTCRAGQNRVKPAKRVAVELAVWRSRYAGVDDDNVQIPDRLHEVQCAAWAGIELM